VKAGIIDYDAGNLRSVDTALTFLGINHVVAKEAAAFDGCDVLIVPGVGEAATAMGVLKERGLDELIINHARSGKRTIGICLGFQLFLEFSDERDTGCLSLLPGKVRRFANRPGMKVPHMGWNQLSFSAKHPVYAGIPDRRSFYFVHSYYADLVSTPDTIGITDYAERFTSVVAKNNIIAFQFHPEKSGEYGLRLLANAVKEDFYA
jgi:imidazole glycerol-phosphate synthase subunit HisH